ncbi:MAG TPA: MarR family transcriptional regulator [Acidimicrobiia bacterium]|nr:MarR family transcriptional regulator [Acidimicrobiia bacterium]
MNIPNPQPRTSYLVARLDRLIRARLVDALKPLEVTVPQYTLLSVLDIRPGLSNAQLARRSYISAQAMHQVVNGLEARGLISRRSAPDHGRAQPVDLTAAGRALLAKCDKAVGKVEDDLFGELAPGDEGVLRRIVESAIDGARRPTRGAADG